MNTTDDERRIRWLMLFLALLTAALYAPTWNHQLLHWDDDVNVLENPLVTSPGLIGLKKIFTSIFSTDYYPITYLSLALDHFLWNGNFIGCHVTQILLHAINSALVLMLVWRWTKSVPVAVMVGVCFAWHPVQVESVSWVAERKNLLGTCFVLLAWLAYLRAETQPRWRLASLILFLLGAMSHALVIVMPVMLGLYEVCVRRARWTAALERVWLFLVPAGFAALMRVLGHGESGQLTKNFSSWSIGALTMTKVLGEYLTTLVYPAHLNNYYVEVYVAKVTNPGFLMALSWLAAWGLVIWRVREHRPWTIFALGWFLVGLLPVLQLVPHPTVRADRYLYSAMLGPLLVLALIANQRPVLLKVAGVIVAVCLAALTLHRIPDWQNSQTLWTDSVTKDPHSAVAHYSLSGVLMSKHDWVTAEQHARRAAELKTAFPEAYERLGTALLMLGRREEARENLERALALDPTLAYARQNLALIKSTAN